MAARRRAACAKCVSSSPLDPSGARKRSTPTLWCASGWASGLEADERSSVERSAQPPLRLSARHDPRRRDADARWPRPALSRHRPRLPCRALPGGTRRSLYTPHLSPFSGTATSNSIRPSNWVLGSDLAAIAWFFDRLYETPVAALTPQHRGSGSSPTSASVCAAQGRLREALLYDADGAANVSKGIGETRRQSPQI